MRVPDALRTHGRRATMGATIGALVDTTAHADQVLATAEQVASLPRRQVRDHRDIDDRSLWTDGRTRAAGVMEFAPGASMAEHSHSDHSHHLWVVAGSLVVLDQELTAGGYAHVPPGVPHAVHAGADGCTLFYVFANE